MTAQVAAASLDTAMGSFLRTVADLERARGIAVELEQENAHLLAENQALCARLADLRTRAVDVLAKLP